MRPPGRSGMDAIVVYESLWGNTAEVARAVAEGLGPGARALRADEAGPDAVAGAELVVAGAPVLGFKLSSPKMRDAIRQNPGKGPAPDLSCPLVSAWLEGLAPASGWGAAFDTRVRGPFGKGAPEIARLLEAAGYRRLAEPEGFVVKGKHGPLRDGELERARAWGEQLARAVRERRDP
jgi:flavodoxin